MTVNLGVVSGAWNVIKSLFQSTRHLLNLKKEVDFIPPDSIVYVPKKNESRGNIQKIKKESNQDIFGNIYTSIQSVPVAHLYPHSFLCLPYLDDLFTFFYGLDQNNSTVSKGNALLFLFGFKKT
jgi:hypothetical protein